MTGQLQQFIQKVGQAFFAPPEPRILPDARTYQMGGGWGCAINWMDDPPVVPNSGKVVGWKSRKPRVGDLLETKMRSGKVGTLVFTEIRPCGDPPDMFFGTVEWVKVE